MNRRSLLATIGSAVALAAAPIPALADRKIFYVDLPDDPVDLFKARLQLVSTLSRANDRARSSGFDSWWAADGKFPYMIRRPDGALGFAASSTEQIMDGQLDGYVFIEERLFGKMVPLSRRADYRQKRISVYLPVIEKVA